MKHVKQSAWWLRLKTIATLSQNDDLAICHLFKTWSLSSSVTRIINDLGQANSHFLMAIFTALYRSASATKGLQRQSCDIGMHQLDASDPVVHHIARHVHSIHNFISLGLSLCS